VIAALARRAFDAAERPLVRLAPRLPRLAFALARVAGAWRWRLSRRWPSAADVRLLVATRSRREAAALARRIAAQEAMHRVLAGAIRRHGAIDFLQPLVTLDPSLTSIRAPAILVTFHLGAIQALGAALERMPVPVVAFRDGRLYEPAGSLTIETTQGGELHRALTFHRALGHLGRDGLVMLAADVVPGVSIDVPFLGRTLRLARGPFALACRSGAPLVPLAARAEGNSITAFAGAPLLAGGPCDETALAAALAAWLESYVAAHPAELTVALVNAVLRR
jgi:hypothetical protein